MWLDSLRFLDSSLDNITSLIDKCAFKITKNEFGGNYSILPKKLVYPKDYFHEMKNYDKTISEIKNKHETKLSGNPTDEGTDPRNTKKKKIGL